MRNEIWLAISTLIIAINTIPVAASSKDAYLAETDSTVVVRDYIANMEYVNGVLERVNFEGGYIDMTGESPRYMYYVTDHLGNVRTVVDEDGNVCQVNHYYPYGDRIDDSRDISAEGSGNMRLFGGKEYSEDTGLHDFEARYDNTLFGRFTTLDPMAEKYYSVSPYAYCAGNPVNFVDPDGKLISTHTDAYGKVIAVYDDGDLGVYRHNLDNAAAREEVSDNYSMSDTSAGGEYMGKSLHAFSFAYNDYNNKSVRKEPDDVAISFSSSQLTDEVESIINTSPSVLEYARKAQSGGVWDIKVHIKQGSLLYGRYASPRDAGNFAAGMFAASKGNLEPLIMYGYGAYNLCGNSKIRTAGYVMLNAISPPNQSLKMSKYAYWKGEDELSRLGQTMGMEYYRKGYER